MAGGSPIPNQLLDPMLELDDSSGALLIANDNWKDSQEQAIIDTGIPPTNDAEAAIFATLAPGYYTAIISGVGNTTGIGLLEIYDLTATTGAEILNLSARAFVGADDNVLIDGLIVSGGTPKAILLRAIGPSLAANGITNYLADPFLELHDADGVTLATNDNWKDASNAADIQATTLAPPGGSESAILTTLPAGNYTAVIRGVNGTSGVALGEVYNIGN